MKISFLHMEPLCKIDGHLGLGGDHHHAGDFYKEGPICLVISNHR